MRWIILLLIPVVYGQEPAQVARGRKVFFESEAVGTRCGNCHAIEKKGTPAGPDLGRLAMLNPRAIKMAVLSTATQYVVSAKMKTGATFPAMKGAEEGAEVQLFDLSTNPPELKKVPKADVEYQPNTAWKHPPESTRLTAAQLADVIAFLRFAATGDKKTIRPEDVE
jgi:hypothetical protein